MTEGENVQNESLEGFLIVVAIFQPPSKSRHLSRDREAL